MIAHIRSAARSIDLFSRREGVQGLTRAKNVVRQKNERQKDQIDKTFVCPSSFCLPKIHGTYLAFAALLWFVSTARGDEPKSKNGSATTMVDEFFLNEVWAKNRV